MAPKRKTATSVSDFTVLPLKMPSTKAYPHSPTHYLYLRPNAPRIPTETTPRELFIANIPVDATESQLRSVFTKTQLGGARVENVEFEEVRVGKGIKAPGGTKIQAEGGSKKRKRGSYGISNREGEGSEEGEEDGEEIGQLPSTSSHQLHASGSTAVVRFVDRASAELSLRSAKRQSSSPQPLHWSTDETSLLGIARYRENHTLTHPSPQTLQTSVDAFMATFAAREKALSLTLARQRSVPDSDGFVTVTRGGRNGVGREETAKRALEEEGKRKERKKRVGEDFYRFQNREKRKEAARDLVREFEGDRRRVEEMRKRKGVVRPE